MQHDLLFCAEYLITWQEVSVSNIARHINCKGDKPCTNVSVSNIDFLAENSQEIKKTTRSIILITRERIC